MLVQSKREFWAATASRQPYIEVTEPKLIRSILLRHYIFRSLGLGSVFLAIFSAFTILEPLTDVRRITSDILIYLLHPEMELYNSSISSDCVNNIKGKKWTDILYIFLENAATLLIVLFSSGTARFFLVSSIPGKVCVASDPPKLTVGQYDHSSYYSRLLGITFVRSCSNERKCPK